MFPMSIEGDVHELPSRKLTSKAVIARLSDDLRNQGMSVSESEDLVSFTNNAFFQWSFRRYVTVGDGEFRVISTDGRLHIHYHLSLGRLVLAVTFITFIIGGATFAAENINS